jgi:hypothetical protein
MSKATARRKLVYALAAEAAVEWRTVENWLRGGKTRPIVDEALERATEKLALAAEVEKLKAAAA